jgi:hypothetical protein
MVVVPQKLDSKKSSLSYQEMSTVSKEKLPSPKWVSRNVYVFQEKIVMVPQKA